ncbi:MAG: NAD kinase [Acidimicrobiales bacterium]|nr:MAG: NAD(+)/NADH kinase [Actinomycetota bacterium]MBV6507129.1 NAD kinase [Acidimicrobiales bacterium]RIK05573.1 MAG: hypothetical protein DCC48_09810 [Acidobacteriota bacterium]
MATVALIVHHDREVAATRAAEAARWLEDRGHEVRIPIEDAAVAGLGAFGCEDAELTRGLDLAVSLGGDGSMLRTVDLVADDDVPVLGVNVGQLGYLTEVEPSGLRTALKRFLAGSYGVEERMRIHVAVDAPSGGIDPRVTSGLNEAVMEKTATGHTVRLGVSFDGEYFTDYVADGLILATPTGSTAYAFSARGPIIAPTHWATLLTPVSPHMLFDRSLVLEPKTRTRVQVTSHRDAVLSVDGNTLGSLHEGDSIEVTAAKRPARLVTFGPRDFHRILKAKFGLNER